MLSSAKNSIAETKPAPPGWRYYKGEPKMDNQLMERIKNILETLTELRGHL
jgi:hypothetical protein